MNIATDTQQTTITTPRRQRRRLALAAAAGVTGLVLVGSTAGDASARPESGIDTRSTTVLTTAPTVARIGAQIVRCDTGEGNLSGAGALAPLTLSDITTCSPASPAPPSAAEARQLEHDPLR
jgi:hypothetical protein